MTTRHWHMEPGTEAAEWYVEPGTELARWHVEPGTAVPTGQVPAMYHGWHDGTQEGRTT